MKRGAIILCALLCMASRHPDRMVRGDLVLNASFNRGDASDRSMYEASPTLAGNAVITAGNRYLSLDGTGDYLQYPDADHHSHVSGTQDQPFSLSCWVYFNTTPGGNITLASKASSVTTIEWDLRASAGVSAKPQFIVSNPTASAYIGRLINTPPFTSGAWYHVAATYSGSEATSGLKIYVNGTRLDDADLSSGSYTGMTNGTSPLVIGSAYGGEFVNGRIDDAREYNRELSANEVAAIYSEGHP